MPRTLANANPLVLYTLAFSAVLVLAGAVIAGWHPIVEPTAHGVVTVFVDVWHMIVSRFRWIV